MTEEANNIVANLEGLAERRSIVLYNEEWHKGVIGIVPSRLTEVYYRPAVVLTRTDDMATGSARSVSGFDVYKAIDILTLRQTDVLLIAGDVFDVANPSAAAQRRFFRFLREANRRNPQLQIVIIAGNHDSAADRKSVV